MTGPCRQASDRDQSLLPRHALAIGLRGLHRRDVRERRDRGGGRFLAGFEERQRVHVQPREGTLPDADAHHDIARRLARSQCDERRMRVRGKVGAVLVNDVQARLERRCELARVETEDSTGGAVRAPDGSISIAYDDPLLHRVEEHL